MVEKMRKHTSWKKVSKDTKRRITTTGKRVKRKIGYRNLTDKTAKKLKRKRTKNYVNYTDKTRRTNHKRS